MIPPIRSRYLDSAALIAEVIVQIAVRVMFVAACILMAAAAFPLSFHVVVIPIVALGSTWLSSTFY